MSHETELAKLSEEELLEIEDVRKENQRKYPNFTVHSKESFDRMIGKELLKLAKKLNIAV